MAGDEWIAGPAGPLKTDFEHRDIGKNKLNLYDLADTILQLRLTRDEEGDLLTRYAAATGDAPQGERLSLCKLMAGLWTRQTALDGIVKQTHIARCWIELRSLGSARRGPRARLNGRPAPESWSASAPSTCGCRERALRPRSCHANP